MEKPHYRGPFLSVEEFRLYSAGNGKPWRLKWWMSYKICNTWWRMNSKGSKTEDESSVRKVTVIEIYWNLNKSVTARVESQKWI